VSRGRVEFSAELDDDDDMTEDTYVGITLLGPDATLDLDAIAALLPDAPQAEGEPWYVGGVEAVAPLESDSTCDLTPLSVSVRWSFAEESAFVRRVGCWRLRDRI
jgi:hypothetical protein